MVKSQRTRPTVKTIKILLILLLNLFLLFAVTRLYNNPWDETFLPKDAFPLGRGNASDDVRADVVARLTEFQAAYTGRDLSKVTSFTQSLFAADNVVVLGTMPREMFVGFDRVSSLVKGDWESWGDCRFLLDRAHISAAGNVAWVATVGFVRFDLSRFLVLPLRLSGVLVKQDHAWKFQFLQFQFDLDVAWALVVEFVLAIWLVINMGMLLVHLSPRLRPGQATR
jgi:hypothetical protein